MNCNKLNPNVGTLARVGVPFSHKVWYTAYAVGGVAGVYLLPGWWKLVGLPFVWWGLAGLGLMPTIDLTPVMGFVSNLAPYLAGIGRLVG